MNTEMTNKVMYKKESLPEVVLQAFCEYTSDATATLLAVRELIHEVARGDSEIGQLQETLRWGELSFLTQKPNTGSMIRLAVTKSGKPAVFFHCGTTLIETCRARYSHIFEFEKNRAIVLQLPIEDTAIEIRQCVRLALRYKLDRHSQ